MAIRASRPTTFGDILDKGLVIDAFVRVSLVGIEVLTIDARIVIASVDTYLRFAEAVDRLDLNPERPPVGLPEVLGVGRHGGAAKARSALQGMKEAASGLVGKVRSGRSEREHEDRAEPEEESHD
jgi:hypothetical protein